MQNIQFKGKKAAVIGAGVEGVSTAKFLAKKGARVYLLDRKTKEELNKDILKEAESLGVSLILGENYLGSIDEFNLIFRSPSVRPDLPQLVKSYRREILVTSQTKLFFDQSPAPIIGVTGTKGKGTTASLIYEILKAAGKKVFLGGNIGQPPLDFIDKLTPDSLVVLELSSFQLIDLYQSPHIAVILMITSEHLDWHKSTKEYVEAKESIVKYQKENDFVVINKDFPSSLKLGETSLAKKYYLSTAEKVDRGAYLDGGFIVSVTNGWTTIAKIDEIKIPGEHNLQNICAAVAVAGILQIPPEIISKAIKGFKGLSHRLEFVREVDKVRFYDDSASTTPEAAVAAIKAFREPKIVILGGSAKHSDFTLLSKMIIEGNVKGIILIGEEAAQIKKSINKAGHFSGEIIEGLTTMKGIVKKAKKLANPGDVVILSPACASFDMFKDYNDRGNQFKEAVGSLEG